MAEQRYTLSLPPEIYEELRVRSEKHGTSIKEAVRQCLKFGLIAMAASEKESMDIIIRERLSEPEAKDPVYKDTTIKFIW